MFSDALNLYISPQNKKPGITVT